MLMMDNKDDVTLVPDLIGHCKTSTGEGTRVQCESLSFLLRHVCQSVRNAVIDRMVSLQNADMEGLTPRASEYELIWKYGDCRWN